MRRKKGLHCMVVIAVLGLFVPVAVFACASCGCTLSSDWNSVNTKNSSDILVDIRYDYLDQDQLRSAAGTISPLAASQILNNGDMQEVEHYTKNNYVTLDVAYSMSAILGISVQLPYINRSHSTLGTMSDGTVAGDGGGQYTSKTSNIGDAKILLNYQGFLPRHTLGVIAGLKIPSGNFNETGTSTDSTAPGPVNIDRGLQPGTGTTDLIMGLFYLDSFNYAWSYFVQGLFQAALDYRDDYRPGNGINVTVGLRYQGVSWITPQLQFNGRYVLHDTGANADLSSTGGTLAYLSPGVVVPIVKQASVYGFVQLPVYQYVRGVQLAPRFTASLGAKVVF
jgi:hypothetical protein